MAVQNAEGIILRKYLLRETSYILVIFTKEFGKITGVMKGIRNPYPQFAGDFEIFTRCGICFYKRKKSSMDLITQCDALESFLMARKSIERLTYANYFIELTGIVAIDHDQNENLYNVLLKSLRLLASSASAKRSARIFELKFLNALGLSPEFDACVMCGSRDNGLVRFSIKNGGVLCGKCSEEKAHGIEISPGTVNFMRKIQLNEIEDTGRFKVSAKVGQETEMILKRFIAYHINRPIKSLNFQDRLCKAGIL
ncbi:MAG: DNA repair protein RecO [Candidatus Omnitrophota bacterium]